MRQQNKIFCINRCRPIIGRLLGADYQLHGLLSLSQCTTHGWGLCMCCAWVCCLNRGVATCRMTILPLTTVVLNHLQNPSPLQEVHTLVLLSSTYNISLSINHLVQT